MRLLWIALLCLFAPPVLAQPAPLRAPGISAQDDRTRVDITQMPWRAIGKVQTNLKASCTGTLIGPQLVLTSGHCIYQKHLRALLPVSSLHFLAGFKSGDFAAHAKVVRFVHAPGLLAFLRGESRQVHDDWLIMVLDQRLGERFGFLPLARPPVPIGGQVQTAGYSQDHILLLLADPDCQVKQQLPGLIVHDCEVTRGNSGGPILLQQDGQWRVAGVVFGSLTYADKTSLKVAVDVAVLPALDNIK